MLTLNHLSRGPSLARPSIFLCNCLFLHPHHLPPPTHHYSPTVVPFLSWTLWNSPLTGISFLPLPAPPHLTHYIAAWLDFLQTAPTGVNNPSVFPIGNRTKSNPQPGIQGLPPSDFFLFNLPSYASLPSFLLCFSAWNYLGFPAQTPNTLPLYWLFLDCIIKLYATL